MNTTTLSFRIRNGWPIEEALNTPVRQTNVKYTYNGQTLTLKEWAKVTKIKVKTLQNRLDQGWPLDRTLMESPVSPKSWEVTGKKVCQHCNLELPIEMFHRVHATHAPYPYCKDCYRYNCTKKRNLKRYIVIQHYSPEFKCQLCPETRIAALDVDHINGVGITGRKATTTLLTEIIERSFPDEYRILCRNCNWLEALKRLGKRAPITSQDLLMS